MAIPSVFRFALVIAGLFPIKALANVPNAATDSFPKRYHVAAPPLETNWTGQVGTHPWPQHPRPLLFRERWQNLNGIWTYRPAASAEDLLTPPGLPLAREVLIPSCIESGLSGIQEQGIKWMWFGTTFNLTHDWPTDGRVLLHFEAVDYEATVFLNGHKVGSNTGGYFRFSIDIKDHIRHGPNDLLRVSGYINSSSGVPHDVTIRILDNTGKEVAMHSTYSDQQFNFRVDSPALWTPEEPNLYNITVTMGNDMAASYTGFRTISRGVVNGVQRPLLNGEFVFLFGTLDQGYWPDGIYVPPTIDAMLFDIKLLKLVGMNMVRKHIKIEPDLFYHACDQLGLLVFQDMPSMRPTSNAHDQPPTDAQQAEFERQVKLMVDEHKSYPSIAAWIIYNEGWGQLDRPRVNPEFRITDEIRSMDPTRLVNAVSGWWDHGAGDFSDNHHYAEPQCGTPFYSGPSSAYDNRRIGIQGEFGGIGHVPPERNLWPIEEAVRDMYSTYEINADLASYEYRSHVLLGLLRDQIARFNCSAAVWTQTTDVEGEINGLVSYDRNFLRANVKQWRADIQALYDAAEARA
ncbi:hypothetical protein OQA88_4858 [Cercophora sp. LCS_1]